jgi:mono/diheme cytochrome c family protein
MFAFGIAVPILVGVFNGAHRAKVGPAGIKLSAAEATGRSLFAAKCATCHTLAAAGAVGRVGPNLDIYQPPESLILDAIAHGRARGNGQMPPGLYEGRDATDVARFVAAVEGH